MATPTEIAARIAQIEAILGTGATQDRHGDKSVTFADRQTLLAELGRLQRQQSGTARSRVSYIRPVDGR